MTYKAQFCTYSNFYSWFLFLPSIPFVSITCSYSLLSFICGFTWEKWLNTNYENHKIFFFKRKKYRIFFFSVIYMTRSECFIVDMTITNRNFVVRWSLSKKMFRLSVLFSLPWSNTPCHKCWSIWTQKLRFLFKYISL